jgi:ABC-type amino acid transport substrate-binding protein
VRSCAGGLLLVAAIGALTPGASAEALVVMVEDDAAPWSQADGTGIANDIVREAFAVVGVDVELRTVAYARCKYEVANGTVAACFSMADDPTLAGKVVMPQHPLFHIHPQYFHNPQRPLQAKSEAEIRPGTVIGIVEGYEYPPAVAELARRGVVLERAASESANLKKLASGRIDATIVNLGDLKSAQFLLHGAGVEDKVTPLFPSADIDAYIGFSAQHPRGSWARAKFDEGFAIIERDGTLNKILARWRARMSH